MTIKEAKDNLDNFNLIKKYPSLIFTELFKHGTSSLNLLYRVSIDGESVLDCVSSCLEELEMFHGCKTQMSGYTLDIIVDRISGMYMSGYSSYILKIDLHNKVVYNNDSYLESCDEILAEVNTYEPEEISKIYKNIKDITFKRRVSCAFKAHSFWDFFLYLFTSRKKLNEYVDKEQHEIDRRNKRNKQFYEKDVAVQKRTAEVYEEYFGMVDEVRRPICEYLLGLGYSVGTLEGGTDE